MIRVDEKLTERRDEASLNGINGTREKGADMAFSGSEPVTRDFRRRADMLDAEEVRGSNPLAPTSKGPGHGPFLFERAEGIEVGRPEVDEKLTRRVCDELTLSAGSRDVL